MILCVISYLSDNIRVAHVMGQYDIIHDIIVFVYDIMYDMLYDISIKTYDIMYDMIDKSRPLHK